MKKIISLILVLALSALCVGCGSTAAGTAAEPEKQSGNEPAAAAPAPEQTAEPAITTQQDAQESTAEPVIEEAGNRVLVVFFSATGTTKGIAEKIASLTGADLVEIVPAQPYTSEDLNYNDRTTRATVEQNTPDARPEIANEISLEGVETLYLGYPIWWGQAPRIMSTFVESHDFTGITVIPFCTSGGSGAGRTGETLGEQAGTGTFLTSTRFSAGVSDSDLQAWIDRMN